MSNEFSELFTFIPAFLMVTIAMSGCADKDGSTLNLIPKPVEVVLGDTSFQIDQSTQIRVEADQPRLMEVAGYFADQLEIASGLRLQVSPVAESRDQHNAIIFSSQKEEYGPEGYNLDVSATQVVIRGEPAGVFYAVQTLFQLLPPQIFAKDKSENQPVKWKIPAVHITDTPRFRWRGMHLDVGRHMFPVDFIKRYIDYIAMHKMNVFHWHLTEDQGWRIEIK
ncbi:MAG: beta-N-acetylglucosaminidase, partial [Calditrichales bacterium]